MAKINNYKDFMIISDLGSGLNYKKKGLNQLIELIVSKKISKIIVTHRDRMIRFGFEII
jgi:predicted site-specific integrase-resolvase